MSTRPDLSGFFRERAPTARERRDFRRAHPDLMVRTETVVLTVANTRRPGIVERARETMVERLERWCRLAGREVVEVTWATDPPDKFELVTLRLEAATVHRTDGEWPALHRAMAEDEADRAAVTAAKTTVDDRLDALAAGARYWADQRLRGL